MDRERKGGNNQADLVDQLQPGYLGQGLDGEKEENGGSSTPVASMSSLARPVSTLSSSADRISL